MKNRIAEYRKERGMTQRELADLASVSRQTITSLEIGKYNPSIILAYRIAAIFLCKIEDIFIYEGE
ncbi:putative transcriptional regulator [Desulfosporosinus orientis DSM 765]|uniref:Putative transcriptional regulator n=1 Tax=Desulfosporosinus orientis (strain ATCC 19365 / DSM 765 / NCIMB 8382 / VKM B-1628 / Singapore I) TaxID=768706 RepID=G7WDD1_DESOD|nr:helix-turn-helix transcriptional regulator [Desulfosporosinus orientis]AET67900.1 putative transcriptional regulator [Desulfosporosinus orientis DSM 765]